MTKKAAQIEDVRTERPYLEGNPAVVAMADIAGARSLLIVPMLKDNDLIGAIGIIRTTLTSGIGPGTSAALPRRGSNPNRLKCTVRSAADGGDFGARRGPLIGPFLNP